MKKLSIEQLRGRRRRRLFWVWVAASVFVAFYTGLLSPFASYFGEGRPMIAVSVHALVIFFLVTGLAWLVLPVLSRGGKAETRIRKGRPYFGSKDEP